MHSNLDLYTVALYPSTSILLQDIALCLYYIIRHVSGCVHSKGQRPTQYSTYVIQTQSYYIFKADFLHKCALSCKSVMLLTRS
jgi:hypothetical protein